MEAKRWREERGHELRLFKILAGTHNSSPTFPSYSYQSMVVSKLVEHCVELLDGCGSSSVRVKSLHLSRYPTTCTSQILCKVQQAETCAFTSSTEQSLRFN